MLVLGGNLRLRDLEQDDAEKAITTLKRTGPNTFLSEPPNDHANDEGQSVVEFQVDATGRAVSLTFESGAYRLSRVE